MNEKQSDTSPQLREDEAAELLRQLLHKEGKWVDWGKICQRLQKAGYNPQTIFEQTGFQSSQQNLIIVAAQVYESLVQSGASPETLTYFQGPKSDVLYEFRILNQEQRLAVAELAREKRLDVDEAKELAKAFQEFSRFSQFPAGFTHHPGDALAYQCWKQAKQKKDIQARTRLIAKGLRFAHSASAREAIEKLLSDFTTVSSVTAPLMPVHRLEQEEELARIVPLIGSFPLSKKDLETVIFLEIEEPFRTVTYKGEGTIVPLPGWQVILKAQAPVAILCSTSELPQTLPGKPENVLVVVDISQKQWDVNSYFLVEQEGKLTFQWFAKEPDDEILGQVVLVLRQKKIFDENNLTEPWQMDD